MEFAPDNISFYVQSSVVVIGTNPEAADISNPRGDIFGEVIAIYAANPHGDTRYLPVDISKEAAERMVVNLGVRADLGRLPAAFSQWQVGRPQYGSDAYIEYGQDDDVALERAEEF